MNKSVLGQFMFLEKLQDLLFLPLLLQLKEMREETALEVKK
jgi:hypothetical protein